MVLRHSRRFCVNFKINIDKLQVDKRNFAKQLIENTIMQQGLLYFSKRSTFFKEQYMLVDVYPSKGQRPTVYFGFSHFVKR